MSGNCEYTEFGRFNGKPVRWRILEKEVESMLLISEPLFRKCYHDIEEKVCWKDCTLRKWLCGEFYSSSFTEEERSLIMSAELHNESNHEKWVSPNGTVLTCKGEGGESTTDSIYLLSLSDFRRYYGERCDDAHVWWWLRTPGRASYRAVTVSDAGELYIGGDFVDSGIFIRPVMRVRII